MKSNLELFEIWFIIIYEARKSKSKQNLSIHNDSEYVQQQKSEKNLIKKSSTRIGNKFSMEEEGRDRY